MATRSGDVNIDGLVNISDVTVMIDMLLNGSTSYSSNADVNLDGSEGYEWLYLRKRAL